MRRSIVGIGLVAGLVLGARGARADVITFYGCAQDLPEACILINMTGSPASGFVGLPVPSTAFAIPIETSSGALFALRDSFSWSLSDGSCSGGNTDVHFNGGSCAAQNAASMVITGTVQWSPARDPSGLFLPSESSLITLTATPEPRSVFLVVTSFVALGAVRMARRRPFRAT